MEPAQYRAVPVLRPTESKNVIHGPLIRLHRADGTDLLRRVVYNNKDYMVFTHVKVEPEEVDEIDSESSDSSLSYGESVRNLHSQIYGAHTVEESVPVPPVQQLSVPNAQAEYNLCPRHSIRLPRRYST